MRYIKLERNSVRTILQVLNMATLIYIEIIEDEDAIFIMTGRHFFSTLWNM